MGVAEACSAGQQQAWVSGRKRRTASGRWAAAGPTPSAACGVRCHRRAASTQRALWSVRGSDDRYTSTVNNIGLSSGGRQAETTGGPARCNRRRAYLGAKHSQPLPKRAARARAQQAPRACRSAEKSRVSRGLASRRAVSRGNVQGPAPGRRARGAARPRCGLRRGPNGAGRRAKERAAPGGAPSAPPARPAGAAQVRAAARGPFGPEWRNW